MKIFQIFIYILLSYSTLMAESSIDSVTLTKVKKLIEKEEELAVAYKEYLLKEGIVPSSLDVLKEKNYLPKGFSTISPFGKEIKTKLDKIESSIPDNVELKTNIFDYYYSNKYRIHTQSPISVNNNKVEIVLTTKEKFIYENTAKITIIKPEASKYYLDKKSILHWYDKNGKYQFSVDNELIVDKDVNIFDTDEINVNPIFKDMIKNVTFSGQTIIYQKDGKALEYVNLGTNLGVIKVNSIGRDVGKTIIQFSRRSGGMIVNGDIYAWGNNANNITGIGSKSFKKGAYTKDGEMGSSVKYPVITSLVRVKAKIYDNDSRDGKDLNKFYEENYFSSPLRPKFIDFFSTVYHGTCGISTIGELYCGGAKGEEYSFGNNFTHVDNEANNSASKEMMYRSRFFDGVSKKAAKIFANNQLWLILSQDGDIYRWGYDHGSGFSGNGENRFNYSNRDTNKNPENIMISDSSTNVKFTDITYLLTIGYRKMGALSTTGDIYIWGVEDEISNNNDCKVTWEGIFFNLCKPTKVTKDNSTLTSNVTFQTIYGGLESFLAITSDGKYYKIHQPKGEKIQVELINETIANYPSYIKKDDINLLSVDFSSKLNGSTLRWNKGIVWVNSKNELKGDYFTNDNKNDQIFKDAIKKIKWKKIKVIEDDNGMCGIDIYNQMYCWGMQSFYRSGNSTNDRIGNTFMIPVFNTNLYDLDKDYLVAEGGGNGNLTSMISDKGTEKPFFIKYPTYVGGFNYEFIFK